MKDYQPPTSSSPTSESLPRVQRIRNIPIERIPSPNNNNISNISENNITATTTILPKKLNEEYRFRIHSNQVERKILPGAAFLPKIQQHHSNHRHHGIATTPTLANQHNHHHHRRFDGYQENQQHPLNNHSQQQQQYYNLRTTPFGESLRHRTNTPGSYSSSYEHQQHQPSAVAGISLVAQYGVGVGQDTGHSTASTPSASRPKLFPGNSNRGGSLPTSHSINLPNHSYNYRIQMPSRQSQHSSPIPPHPHQKQQHRHHSNHQHHIHDSNDILPEIEASGFPQDPIIEAERQEPDYHLVESGSDVLLSTKDDVPAPAPTGPSTTNSTAKNKIFLETDIVDSSCDSDEDDDDVVKNCDIEDAGNTIGMNRKF
jgi:hypothetical protein